MKTSTQKLFNFLIIGAIVITGCDRDSLNTYNVEGKAQKGPYIVGSLITISELDENLNQTGKVISSTIIDDQGKFEIPEFEFASNFVQLTADGHYFNEMIGPGSVTSDRLILTSIADLNETRTININILSHIEVERLRYLVKEEKISFSEAKKQCYTEILKIFEINPTQGFNSERLDISATGSENTGLLVISSIVHANRSIPALTEFLTRIQTDVKEDGILDSESIQSDLITSALFLDCNRISQNLKNRYLNLGLEMSAPELQPFVDSFLIESDYEKLVEIYFPQNTQLGINILRLDDTVNIDPNENYCIAVNQECKVDYLATNLRIEDVNYPSNKDVYISNIQNWQSWENLMYDTIHFGSRRDVSFWQKEYTGDLNLQMNFEDQVALEVRLEFAAGKYGDKTIIRYLH